MNHGSEPDNVLLAAQSEVSGWILIDVRLAKDDIYEPLRRLTASLGNRARAE